MAWEIEADVPAPQGKGGWVIEDAAPDPTGSFTENLAAGAGKALTDLGRGARQIGAKVMDKISPQGTLRPTREQAVQAEVDESRKLDAPLMSTGGGVTGNIAGLVAPAVATSFIPGANTYTGTALAGGVMGLLQPTAEGESRALNTGLGAGFGVAGKYAGGKIGDMLTNRAATKATEQATRQASNTTKDATLAASKAEGYVVPPAQANPNSAWNQLLESFSGKVKTGQAASMKNQEVTNRLAKAAVGIADDQPLNAQALEAVRQQAGQAYKAVESLPQIAPDSAFTSSVAGLARQKGAGAVTNPADDAIDKLVTELKGFAQWDGKSLIADIKNLREMSKANLGAANRAGGDVGKSALGKAQAKAANMLEDLAERNLNFNNAPGNLIEEFRNARQLIAKTYSIENALNESTGNVIGSKLAGQLARGKPLSGGLKTAAQFAQAFPDAAREATAKGSSSLMGSPLDWGAAAGLSAVTQNPLMLGAVAARPTVRSLLLSAPYQRAMANPDYAVGALTRLGGGMSMPIRRLLPGAAIGSGIAYADE